MAKPSDFQYEVSKRLECSICMSLLQNPKVLQCHHWFCKVCIDKLLQFVFDGSAVAICPMKCKDHTLIAANKTTNDLAIPYQLTGILDLFKNENEVMENHGKDLICSGELNCKYNVSFFCKCCSSLFCHACSLRFRKKHGIKNNFCVIQYDKKDECLVIMCSEHSTRVTYICNSCGFYICEYCLHRKHKTHQFERCDKLVEKLRDFIENNDRKIEDLNTEIHCALDKLNAVKVKVNLSRNKLKKSLAIRKINCLHKYLKVLERAEITLLGSYDKLAEDHMREYPEPILIDNLRKIGELSDFHIIAGRKNIEKARNYIQDGIRDVMPVMINFSNSPSMNPLGSLRHGTPDMQDTCSFQADFSIPDLDKVSINLVKDVEELMKEAEEVNQSCNDIKPRISPLEADHSMSGETPMSSNTLDSNFEEIVSHLDGLRDILVDLPHVEEDFGTMRDIFERNISDDAVNGFTELLGNRFEDEIDEQFNELQLENGSNNEDLDVWANEEVDTLEETREDIDSSCKQN